MFRLLLILIIMTTGFLAQSDPCSNIQSITCGTNVSFSSNGPGDPLWKNNIGCNWNNSQGGQETIYMFSAPITGYYQVNCISATGGLVFYSYKPAATGCTIANWSCLQGGYGVSAPGPVGSIYLNANDSIYLLVNTSDTGPLVTQQFIIQCGYDVCSNIQSVVCDSTINFTSSNYGDPRFDNNHACSWTISDGGQESIYLFTAPTTGNYQVNCLSATGMALYSYKPIQSGCTPANWTCLQGGNGATTPGPVGSMYLNANDSVYILINAVNANTQVNHQFIIQCHPDVCSNIQAIACNSVVNFTGFGYGDPRFDNNHSCNWNTGTGGQESLYLFTAPITGNYQVNCLSATGMALYSYKPIQSGCTPANWTCLQGGNGATTPGPVGSMYLNANDSIYLLVNAVNVSSPVDHQFAIHCGSDVCSNIQPIVCDSVIYFASTNYGDPRFDNDHSCNWNTGTGGEETIYSLPASMNGYHIDVTSTNGGPVIYSWKYDSLGCSNNGWNCLGIVSNTASFNFNPVSCSDVSLLVNSAGPVFASGNFKVVCTDCNVGIPEVNENFNFIISPNVTSDYFTIKQNAKGDFINKIQIRDVRGKLIWAQSETYIGDKVMDISQFEPGMYFIVIGNEKGIGAGRIIKR